MSSDSNEVVGLVNCRVYYEKLGLIKAQLAQLDEGVHPEYLRGVEKFTSIYKER
jgi:hypothetical protein